MGGSDNKGDGLASQPRRYRVPGQPLLSRHQVGGVSRSPDGLFAQQEWEPIRGRPTVRGKRTYGGRPGQRVEEQCTWASQKHSEAGYGRPVDRGAWTAKTVKRPPQQPAHPQYANYWAPLTRKRHIPPHPAQPRHTNNWAPRTRQRHRQEHRPQQPTESSDPTQHAKGRTGDCPGPRKETRTRRNVTRGGGLGKWACVSPPPPPPAEQFSSRPRHDAVRGTSDLRWCLDHRVITPSHISVLGSRIGRLPLRGVAPRALAIATTFEVVVVGSRFDGAVRRSQSSSSWGVAALHRVALPKAPPAPSRRSTVFKGSPQTVTRQSPYVRHGVGSVVS